MLVIVHPYEQTILFSAFLEKNPFWCLEYKKCPLWCRTRPMASRRKRQCLSEKYSITV